MNRPQTAVLVVIVATVLGFAGVRAAKLFAATSNGAPAVAEKGGPIPVKTAPVAKKDVAIIVEGLGTVTPLASVTVKTLVDGRLDKIVFKEGADVKQGDLLAIVDPRPFQVQVEQGQAALERDEANHVNSKVNLDRYEKLRQGNLIPQQQVDDQRASVKQLGAAVMADKAQIESGHLMLDYAYIKSPVTGVTGIRLVDQGNVVHPSDPNGIVVVTQLDPITVVFTLPEDILPRVQRALAGGKPSVEAVSRNGNEKLATGELDSIDNQVNVQTATIRLKALFHNADRRLWPNQFVKAKLHVDTLHDAIVVPTPAIQRGAEGSAFVYVVDNGSATNRPVEVASVEGDETVLAKGLSPGEIVVVDGQNLIRPGAKVVPRDRERGAAGICIGASVRLRDAAAMSISEPFIRRPIATLLLMVGLLLAGIVAYRQLPVAALPQVDYPTIVVSTNLPGASAETMASSVTTPLERQFGMMPALDQMTSLSSFGQSQITLVFSLDRSLDAAEQDVQAAINAASNLLPPTLPTPPVYSKSNPADAPVITLAVSSTTLDMRTVNDVSDSILAQKLSQVSGVGLVAANGMQRRAVRVQVDPFALAGAGLSLEDVRTALVAANVNQPKGNIDGKRQDYTIATDDQLMKSDDYNNVIVAYKNGAAVRLVDVAKPVDGAENTRLAAWANGKRAVILNVQRQPGANVIDVSDRIKALIPRLKSAIPQGIDIAVLQDRTESVRASVEDVEFTLVITIGLVVLVVFSFLRTLRATSIPAVAVPLSLVGTFGVMYLLGYSLNNLSLMALTIATGFVVDDAIVMVENVARHVEHGMKPFQAALKGAKEIGFTIVSLTVSLVAVLIPLLFMRGLVGRLFREFAVTLATAIVLSALLSLTLTAMMSAHVLKPEPPPEQRGHFYRMSEAAFEWMVARYDTGLKWVLNHQKTTLLVVFLTMGLTGYLAWAIPKALFPKEDTGLVNAVLEAPPDVSFDRITELQQRLSEIVRSDPAVADVASFVGADGTNTSSNTGRMTVVLKPRKDRESVDDVLERLSPRMREVPGVSVWFQTVQDLTIDVRQSRTPFQYTVEDADPNELAEWAPKIVEALGKAPELRDVTTDSLQKGLGVDLTIDRDTASRVGISTQLIDDTLYDAFGQRQISTIFTQLNLYRVILELKPEMQRDPGVLDVLHLPSVGGTLSPLSAFVHRSEHPAPLVVTHQGQFPAITVSFDVPPRESLGSAVKAVQRQMDDLKAPVGVRGEFQGTAQAFRESLESEPLLILAALITVYIVLGVLYESTVHPITILSTLPSAGVGALLALWICRMPFTLVALIGVVLLIGIVKKNAIMMIDFALEAQREGKTPREAIHEACLLRFRPIMMTTMAALLGAIPLAIGTGTGSELRRPLGVSIVGGLVLSQVLTLFTTPVIYLELDKLRAWLSALFGIGGESDVPDEAE